MTVGMWRGVHGIDSCRGAQRSADVVAGCFGGVGMGEIGPCRAAGVWSWSAGVAATYWHASTARRGPGDSRLVGGLRCERPVLVR